MSGSGGSTSFVAGFSCAIAVMAALCMSPVSILEIASSFLNPLPYPTHSLEDVDGAVFITGASSGIGKDAAFHMAELGYHVFAAVRKETDMHRIKEEFLERISSDTKASHHSNKLHPIICDVTKLEQVQSSRDEISQWLDQGKTEGVKNRVLIGVVNNAGVSSELEPVEFLTTDSLDWVLDTNLKGPLRVFQLYLPLLRQYGQGRIVNVGSLAGQMARPFRAGYTISKFSLEGFSDTIRQELFLEGISVSMVNPGFIQTGIFDKHQATTDAKYGENSSREELSELQHAMLEAYSKSVKQLLTIAGSVDETSEAIAHALTSKSPRTRYFPGALGVAGLGAEAFPKLKSLLPDRMFDATVLKKIVYR